jgi:transcriptional regulator with XRE-family HTH domain
MKRYNSIGELLIDYREINNLSQSEFAEKINVDTRTVQRWERGETLIKNDKEEEIVIETYLPYQLIRNLNSQIAIPTFYDFRIRKYSTTELANDFPDAKWFKKEFYISNKNVRTIDYDYDIKHLKKFFEFQQNIPRNILLAIRKAIEILPEINLIVTDDSGYYAGQSIIFPINEATFKKLKNREITEEEITANDIVNYKTQKTAIFYNFDIAADNNYNTYYLINHILKFFNTLKETNYIYCSISTRYDSFEANKQFGLNIVWKDEPKLNKMNLEIYPRFYEGTFKTFLDDMKLEA